MVLNQSWGRHTALACDGSTDRETALASTACWTGNALQLQMLCGMDGVMSTRTAQARSRNGLRGVLFLGSIRQMKCLWCLWSLLPAHLSRMGNIEHLGCGQQECLSWGRHHMGCSGSSWSAWLSSAPWPPPEPHGARETAAQPALLPGLLPYLGGIPALGRPPCPAGSPVLGRPPCPAGSPALGQPPCPAGLPAQPALLPWAWPVCPVQPDTGALVRLERHLQPGRGLVAMATRPRHCLPRGSSAWEAREAGPQTSPCCCARPGPGTGGAHMHGLQAGHSVPLGRPRVVSSPDSRHPAPDPGSTLPPSGP